MYPQQLKDESAGLFWKAQAQQLFLNLLVYTHLFDLDTGVSINENRERIEYLATVWT